VSGQKDPGTRTNAFLFDGDIVTDQGLAQNYTRNEFLRRLRVIRFSTAYHLFFEAYHVYIDLRSLNRDES
jgi:hypothetical protein